MDLDLKRKKPGWLQGFHELLTEVKLRQEVAFEVLLEKVKKPSMKLISQKLNPNRYDEEDLEIIFYHAMTKVWFQATSYHGKSKIYLMDKDLIAWAWIKRIIINCALDYYKAEKKHRDNIISEILIELEDPKELPNYHPEDNKTLNEISYEMDKKEELEEFKSSLNIQEHELFNHLLDSKLSKKSIAERMGISPSRVSQLISGLREKYRRVTR